MKNHFAVQSYKQKPRRASAKVRFFIEVYKLDFCGLSKFKKEKLVIYRSL